MVARRRLLTQQSGGLPAEYRQIECLESSGTQYIATNYIPAQSGVRAEWRYAFTSTFSGDKIMWGCKTLTNQRARFYAELYNYYNWYCAIGNPQFRSALIDVGKSIDTIYDASMDGAALTIDGHFISPTDTYASDNVPAMYIFAWNQGDDTAQYLHTALRLYKLSFFENGVKSADFVPCIRISDSKPGMYDTVSKTFYTNAGTGEFIIPS